MLVCTCYFLPQIMPNARVLRDMKARVGFKNNEIARRAYLYVARNQTLSPQVRHQAQLQLNTFGRYTRPTTVKNRCGETGRGRGIIREFALCRVCSIPSTLLFCNSSQYQFRLKALAGELLGVKKASW
jgi:small subunit ribosomal protein S14